jgi:2-hydroxychromene-2-carboxylate isomerase
MPQKIEFFYDFRSPYSYLAFTQLEKLGAEIVLRPMQVLKVMEKVGNVPTTLISEAKGRYARADLARWAQRYRISFNPSDMRANDGDACSRAVLSTDNPADALKITKLLYKAIWSDAKALKGPGDVVAEITAGGLNGAAIAARIDSEDIAAQLASNTDEAAARGVFGSPTMFVGDQIFFGNDRIDFLKEELARLETTL